MCPIYIYRPQYAIQTLYNCIVYKSLSYHLTCPAPLATEGIICNTGRPPFPQAATSPATRQVEPFNLDTFKTAPVFNSAPATDRVVEGASVDAWDILVGQVPRHGIHHELNIRAVPLGCICLGIAVEVAGVAEPPAWRSGG